MVTKLQILIFQSFYAVVIFKGWCPSLTNLQGFLSKQCTVFLHCPYYMFDGCSYPKLWDGQKKMKLSWRNLCCCHFSCCLHIDSRSSYFIYGRLYLIYYHRFHFIALPTFTINFISWTAAAFVTSFISDVADFILTSRVTPMADFILLTTLVSCHSTSYFHQISFQLISFIAADLITLHSVAISIADFILFVT